MLFVFSLGAEAAIEIKNDFDMSSNKIYGLGSATGATDAVNYSTLLSGLNGELGAGIWLVSGDNIQNQNAGNVDIQKMLTVGSASLTVGAGENLIYGNIGAASTGNLLLLQKNGVDQVVITNDGKVGIGITPGIFKFQVASNSGANNVAIGDSLMVGGFLTTDSLTVSGVSTFSGNVSISGGLGVGITSPGEGKLLLNKPGVGDDSIELRSYSNEILQGDVVNRIVFKGIDGALYTGAAIETRAAFDFNTNVEGPMDLVFMTTYMGQTVPQDRLIIEFNGDIQLLDDVDISGNTTILGNIIANGSGKKVSGQAFLPLISCPPKNVVVRHDTTNHDEALHYDDCTIGEDVDGYYISLSNIWLQDGQTNEYQILVAYCPIVNGCTNVGQYTPVAQTNLTAVCNAFGLKEPSYINPYGGTYSDGTYDTYDTGTDSWDNTSIGYGVNPRIYKSGSIQCRLGSITGL